MPRGLRRFQESGQSHLDPSASLGISAAGSDARWTPQLLVATAVGPISQRSRCSAVGPAYHAHFYFRGWPVQALLGRDFRNGVQRNGVKPRTSGTLAPTFWKRIGAAFGEAQVMDEHSPPCLSKTGRDKDGHPRG